MGDVLRQGLLLNGLLEGQQRAVVELPLDQADGRGVSCRDGRLSGRLA
jgi:hypothetical protein